MPAYIELIRLLLVYQGVSSMPVHRIVILGGVFLGLVVSTAWAGDSPSLFDKPLHETHLLLPRDSNNPHNKPMLSCFYYPNFMVKQIDLGEEGADQLSILHVVKGHAEPPCRRANAKDEMVIDPKTWGGYFEGVKGDFVFFVAEDGFNGGLSFAVYIVSDVDCAKIFEDAAISKVRAIAFTTVDLLSDPKNASESTLKLRYRRVYLADCSLRTDEKNCWGRIRPITGLTEVTPPNCSTAYEAGEKRGAESVEDADSDPSVITYVVEVILNQWNPVVRVTPVSKAMECYPAE